MYCSIGQKLFTYQTDNQYFKYKFDSFFQPIKLVFN